MDLYLYRFINDYMSEQIKFTGAQILMSALIILVLQEFNSSGAP